MTRVAVVAGADPRVGRACAPLLAARGLDVAFLGLELSEGDETARQIAAAGRRCLAIPADPSRSESVGPALERVRAALGSPGVLLNCVELDAGEAHADDLAARFAVTRRNLRALFVCGRAVAEQMVRNRWGRIITVAQPVAADRRSDSLGSPLGSPPSGRLSGQAVLDGIAGFTKSAALELTSFGVTVNFIAPGGRAAEPPGPAPRGPAGQPAEPYERGAARTAEFLIGDHAGPITGQGMYIRSEDDR